MLFKPEVGVVLMRFDDVVSMSVASVYTFLNGLKSVSLGDFLDLESVDIAAAEFE